MIRWHFFMHVVIVLISSAYGRAEAPVSVDTKQHILHITILKNIQFQSFSGERRG